jgi:anaerobic dimethyl sulfoxide reductase subunit C (anchor subunit)
MDLREWALIGFTILMQLAVGAFVVLGVVHYATQRAKGVAEADRLSDRSLLAIGPVVGLALIASLFHLGNPLNAPRAITNLATSWLSREILFSVLFTLLGAAFAFMQWRKLGSFTLRAGLAGVAAVIGLIGVYSMSLIYQLPTQPAWNTPATTVTFFTTTLLLGVLALGAAFVANYAYVQRTNPGCADAQCELLRTYLRYFALAAVGLAGIQLIVAPLVVSYLAASPAEAARQSAALMYREFGLVFGLRLALVFIGAGLLGLFIYRNALSAGREKVAGNLAYAAFAIVLVAEVLGRFVFYASHVKVGL